ncbi:transglutaminase family protein [Rhodobacteraceae bacterium CH30]|nr:transglutaminase family protein [Rhodobacteraceae bacterium CH30]
MRLSIRHVTHYHYAEPALRSAQLLRLTPADDPYQTVCHWQLDLPAAATSGIDGYGNRYHLMMLEGTHDTIQLLASGEVDTQERTPCALPGVLDIRVFLRHTALTAASAAITELAHASTGKGTLLEQLGRKVLEAMPYTPGATQVHTPADQALALGAGVCQDHTQVFITACRILGLPARYVSGYLLNENEEHAASHAWAEVWLDHAWHGFDVSNARAPDAHHLKLACGLDYLDACPVRGVRLGGGQEVHSTRADVQLIEN